MVDALVTIVVTPRERFSVLERCLATIVANTPFPHDLVCVLGAAPRYVEELAEKQCAEHGYELVTHPELLSPTAARNLGLERVTTRYVTFLDNDVVVAPGWLEALVGCAEETGADVVGPLCLVGEPEDGVVHSAGGTIELVERDGRCEVVERHLVDNLRLNVQPVALERAQCDFSEFHGMLVRRDVLDRVGPLDEGVSAAAEHIDLALQVRELGGTTWSEPASMISYLSFGADYTLGDLEFFTLRWSEDWCERSLDRFSEKWGISRDAQYIHELALCARALRGRACLRDPDARPTVPDPSAHAFAQTNLQLFNQLCADGLPEHELEEVRTAYDAAVSLFAGRFRPSGKPFLAHLTGTASILAAFGWHPPVVTAGLLHAAYDAGGFPDQAKGDEEAQRRWLRRRVGSLTEAIVHEYAHLDTQRVLRAHENDDFDRLPLNIAYAVVLRIANSIEELLDYGSAYWVADDTREAGMAAEEAWAPVFSAIAPRLGVSEMIDLLESLSDRVARAQIPASLRYSGATNYLVTDSETTQVLTPRSRARRPAKPTPDPGRFVPPSGPRSVRDRVARIPTRAFAAMEGGRVSSRGRSRRVRCDPRQWAYSACAELGELAAHGPAVLRLKIAVEQGELGIGVLVADSWTDLAIPEWSHGPTNGPIEVNLPLPALEESGRIVLRSWAPTGVVTRARVLSAELYAADDD